MATHRSGTALKSKNTAALLAFFLGALGIHQFYLGNTVSGSIRIVLTITIYGALISWPLALVEFIMYLTASDVEFQEQYVLRRKAWPWQKSTLKGRQSGAASGSEPDNDSVETTIQQSKPKLDCK